MELRQLMSISSSYRRRAVDLFSKRRTGEGARLVALGVCVHLVLLYAVFDVYYKSPLVHVSQRFAPTHGLATPAKRLVLFVADGLRAQAFFCADGATRAPFLWNLMSSGRASFGVSQTHVPTESRPGHVALIAGFYEDVSAVTRGWRENPVEFDSLFNQSRTTWSWGSPDILPMFARGAAGNHVLMSMYDAAEENFGSDGAGLDTWVFDRVKALLQSANSNASLSAALHSDRVVFFLHLLGLDTNGHGHKPHSRFYTDNILLVDKGVAATVELLEQFYAHDNRTAYVFTADHGMTDWGSHGAGTDHETMTPLVAWGAGITDALFGKPLNVAITSVPATATTESDQLTMPTGGVPRRDVDQVSLAPLMASLIGVAIPANSVGRLPIGYLKATPKYRFLAAHANYRQMLEQYQTMKSLKKSQTWRFLFNDYSNFSERMIITVNAEITRLTSQARWDAAASLCLKYIPILVDGLYFYHRYERAYLTMAVFASFLSWMCVMAASAFRGRQQRRLCFRPHNGCLLICGCICLLLWLQNLPLHNYIYFLLPVYLCNSIGVIDSANLLLKQPQHYQQWRLTANWLAVRGLCACAGLVTTCMLVAVFSHRWVLSLCLLMMALWPPMIGVRKAHRREALFFSILCLVNGLFPLLPTIGRNEYPRVNLVVAALCTALFGRLMGWPNLRLHAGMATVRSVQDVTRICQIATLSICTFIIAVRNVLLINDGLVAALCQFWSWLILLGCFVTPMMAERSASKRIQMWAAALFSPYLLMSLGHESVFFLVFSLLLYVWVRLEAVHERANSGADGERRASSPTPPLDGCSKIAKDPPSKWSLNDKPISTDDIRRVYFCCILLLLAFFGTGNVASLNSFNPSFTRCFVTVFNPFVMGLLLLAKVLMPILLLTIAYHFVLHLSGRSVIDHLPLMMLIFDSMAMICFLLLKDTGSWLDIGVSISHYILSMSIPLVISLLLHLASYLANATMLVN